MPKKSRKNCIDGCRALALGKKLARSSATIALLTFAVASGVSVLLLVKMDAAFGVLLAALTLYIAAVDIEHFEIPDGASAAIFLLGLAWTFVDSGFDATACITAAVRSLVAAGFLFAVRWLYENVRGLEGLGLGDVKLAGAGASWLGWTTMVVALLVAVSAALIAVAGRSVLAKERIRAHIAVPLGTFLAPAIWLAWFAQVRGI
jgi:leader peptidase (prepilin peptidase) / N-methyltransferase